jgi:hypothetical protein
LWRFAFALLSILKLVATLIPVAERLTKAAEASVVDFAATRRRQACDHAAVLLLEQMVINKRHNGQARSSEPVRRPSGWQPWTIIVPRRAITGEFVFGQVWRRYDGRRWIYRKYVEYADRGRQDN